MGLSHAVHWWQEWQMRVLVLGSLFVYMSLYFAYTVRRRLRHWFIGFLVWSAYVGGDALAIYALATLFNRQRQRSACGQGGGSSDLEVLWAPVLLIHLGGQTTMSAYSLEDNEMWKRHAMTLVSQVAVALYVFCNWWSGERQLLNAAVLLFVVGIIKFSYKPWSLKRASFNNMLASAALVTDRRVEKEGRIGHYWRLCTAYLVDIFNSQEMSRSPQDQAEHDMTLGDFVKRARCHLDNAEESVKIIKEYVVTPVSFLYKMFVNVPRPYSAGLEELQYFLKFTDSGAYKLLQECLYTTFQIIYTRQRVTLTLLGIYLQLSLPFLTLTSVVLFAKSHKGGYDVNDVWVTYILFCFTALHEFFPFVPFFRAILPFRRVHRAKWHGMVSQGSLMSFCARQEATAKLWPNPLWETLNKHCHVKQKHAAKDITDRVRKHITDGWKEYIYGPISYRAFNNLRGQWTLKKYKHKMGSGHPCWSALDSSLAVPYDESVLMWHVATHLRYYEDKGANDKTRDSSFVSRKISKYMAYLLFIHPQMLVPGARSGLFNIASDYMAEILEKSENKAGVPTSKAQGIAQRIPKAIDIECKLSQGKKQFRHLLIDAKKIAEALGALEADDRWQLIDGVWVEMLCFSAARCSGYLHARSLGHGGEFLSYVWLLWSAMGLQTLADKIIMTEPPGDEERKKEEEEEEAIKEKIIGQKSAARARAPTEVYVHHISEEISSSSTKV